MTAQERASHRNATRSTAELGEGNLPQGGRELLMSRIHAHRDRMSRGQRKLADYLLEQPARTAFATANDIGEVAGTSGATVVRFAQFLGYDGFAELRDSLRSGLLPFPTLEEQLSSLAAHGLSTSINVADIVLHQERENLEATAALIDSNDVTRLAHVISQAKRIILVGSGVGGAVVHLLENQLSRLGLSVIVSSDPVQAVITLANAKSDDLVLGVTFWRFARSTNDLLVTAKTSGAATAAIVDSPLFPAADHVDHLLLVRARNAGHGPSALGAIAVANMIVSATILSDFPRFSESIRKIEDAYSNASLYIY